MRKRGQWRGNAKSARRAAARRCLLAAAATGLGLAGVQVAGLPARRPAAAVVAARRSCPWVAASAAHTASSGALAVEVVARMTLAEKLGMIALAGSRAIENVDKGVPRLCIPPLTLSDGPDGIANHAPGSLQLPASIGVAASFDPAVAYRYGRVLGAEARTKGIDVVQAPELNLARVPESGRIFEAYGEDPTLTGTMGVAEVEGIQSEGVMADAKHYTVYNQETSRPRVDEVVSERALEELYQAPFEAVVREAHAASLMCAYGSIDGVDDCSDRALYGQLAAWGFSGFVRSDLESVTDTAAAFRAGLDLLKPATVAGLESLVARHELSVAEVDRAVEAVLGEMFAFGLVARPLPLRTAAQAVTGAGVAFARWAAERSMVLLQDRRDVLPLARHPGSVAVIGTDAGSDPMSTGHGSAYVVSTDVVSPLVGLARALPASTEITYAPGGVPAWEVAPLTSADASSTLLPRTGSRPRRVEPGKEDLGVVRAANVEPQVLTATRPGSGPGWKTWSSVLEVPESGSYELSLSQYGDIWCSLDGRTVLAIRGLHGPSVWATTVSLLARRRYRLRLRWYAVAKAGVPGVGLQDVSAEIAQAVRAARAARVAIVFVSDYTKEGADRPDLELPGDADALIEAVTAVNPRTVVVLNTEGAVLMPWLHEVAAVLEAWYPGQEDGTATAAVLTGAVDPAGRLPLTFPAREDETPVAPPSRYPGIDGKVSYSEGLDIGYRWYLAEHRQPLFPFGYGLSYTSFSIGHPSLALRGGRAVVSVRVRNTGRREGTEVVELYLRYPPAAGEPPEQLRAFAAVTLRPGAARRVHLAVGRSGFAAFVGGRWRVFRGRYRLGIGTDAEHLPVELATAAPRTPPGA